MERKKRVTISAKSGRYVKKEKAKTNPAETVSMRVPVGQRTKKRKS